MRDFVYKYGLICLVIVGYLGISLPAYGAATETTAAAGLSGAATAAPGAEVQIFSIGVTGDASTAVLAINVTLSDLSSATGITASDLTQLQVYRSADNVLGGDTPVGSAQTSINIGSATSLSFSDTPPASEVFYIVGATFSTTVTENHAFKVGFAASGAFAGSGAFGSAVAASDANKLTISVTATKLVFSTQPSGSTSGSALSTQPVVTAQDANNNTDLDFAEWCSDICWVGLDRNGRWRIIYASSE